MGGTCSKDSKEDKSYTPKTKAQTAEKPVMPIMPKVKIISREKPDAVPPSLTVENPLVPPSQKISASPERESEPAVSTMLVETDEDAKQSPGRQGNNLFVSVMTTAHFDSTPPAASASNRPDAEKSLLGKETITAINKAIKISAASASPEASPHEQFSATIEIWLLEAVKNKSRYDVSITLSDFEGNTEWLLGDTRPEIIDINELIPAAIRESHMKLIKTMLTTTRNLRGNWGNLSVKLSRPVRIFNPSTTEENSVSIEMSNAESDENVKKLTLSMKIVKLKPSLYSPLESFPSGRTVGFKPLHPATEAIPLEQSGSPLETSRIPNLRTMVFVSISPNPFENSLMPPTQDEIDFVKNLLCDAGDGAYLAAHFKGRALCYATSFGKERKEKFLTHSYVKLSNNIYYQSSNDNIGITHQRKFKNLTNIETGEICVAKISDSDDLNALKDFKLHRLAKEKKANPFELMFRSEMPSEENPNPRKNIVVNLSSTAILLFYAPSFTQAFSYGLFSLYYPIKKQIFLMNKYDMNLDTFINNTPSLSETFLKKLPLLILNAINNLHTGNASRSRECYVHTNITPEKILLKIGSSDIVVNFCNLTNCMPLNERHAIKITENQTYYAPELLSRFHDTEIKIDEKLKERVKDFPGKSEDEFQHTIESNAFAIGIILTSVINKIFTAPHLQSYKEDLMKIASLLLSYTPSGRISLSTIISVYQYLYDLSENLISHSQSDYKLIYGELTSALIRLSDTYYKQPIFFELHAMIQENLHEAITNNNRQKLSSIVQLINFLHFMQSFLSTLNPLVFNNYMCQLNDKLTLIKKLNLLPLYGFSAPSESCFVENNQLIADIVSVYHSAKEACAKSRFFKLVNAEIIISTVESYKENLCDLSETALNKILQTIMVPEAVKTDKPILERRL